MEKPIDIYKIHKNKVKKNFSAAIHYDNFTSYHNMTLSMTSQTIKKYCTDNKINTLSTPKNVLDIGCGTGQGYFILHRSMSNCKFNYFGLDFALGLLNKAKQKFSTFTGTDNASLICSDAELLPLKHKKFDIVFSNMALHWLNNVEYFLDSVRSILKDDGIIILSFLIFGTLRELAVCTEIVLNKKQGNNPNKYFGRATKYFKLHKFNKLEYIEKKINKSGLKIVSSKIFKYTETADSSIELLKGINKLGAKNTLNTEQMPPGLMRQILSAYDKGYHNANNKVYATYKIAYLVLKK